MASHSYWTEQAKLVFYELVAQYKQNCVHFAPQVAIFHSHAKQALQQVKHLHPCSLQKLDSVAYGWIAHFPNEPCVRVFLPATSDDTDESYARVLNIVRAATKQGTMESTSANLLLATAARERIASAQRLMQVEEEIWYKE